MAGRPKPGEVPTIPSRSKSPAPQLAPKRPLPPSEEPLPPPLPPPAPPPTPNQPPPPPMNPTPPPPRVEATAKPPIPTSAPRPRTSAGKAGALQRPEIKAIIKVALPAELGGGALTIGGHSHMTMTEVITALMTKLYKGQGIPDNEMDTLLNAATATMAIQDGMRTMVPDFVLGDLGDPKSVQQPLKFDFKLIRTRTITEEERKVIDAAKAAKAEAERQAEHERKAKEAVDDADDESKFEGPQTATVDEILSRMLDHNAKPELELRSAFCLNYVNFLTPEAFFVKLVEYYDKPLSAYWDPKTHETMPRAFFLSKVRILEVVKTWVEEFPEDWRSILDAGDQHKAKMTSFGTTDPPSTSSDPIIKAAFEASGAVYKGLADQVDAIKLRVYYVLKTKVSRVTAVLKPPTLDEYLPIDPPPDRMGMLLSAPLDEIVTQFNRMDYNCLCMINMRELTNKWWTRKQKMEKCPNVTRMIDIYNQRSYWVASACLTSPNPVERALCLKFFIKLTRRLLDSYNYFAANAILNGILQAPLSRLKISWEKVSEKNKKLLEDIKVECDRKKNFGVYRTNYAKAEFDEQPCIPNLLVVLQDLYQLEELPTVVEPKQPPTTPIPDKDKVINWHKYGKEFRQAQRLILKQILQPGIHTKLSNPEQNKVGSTLLCVLQQRLEEEDLWDLSYIHEPKSEEHKLGVQWKLFTPEQRQAMHDEELRKVMLVWGPIMEARRARYEAERIRREEENAKMTEALKRLTMIRSEWTKEAAKSGGPNYPRSWNDPSRCTDHVPMPEYLLLAPPRENKLDSTLDVPGRGLEDSRRRSTERDGSISAQHEAPERSGSKTPDVEVSLLRGEEDSLADSHTK